MRLELKMEILRQFGSQRNFAKACGKQDDWISKIIVGMKHPTEEDRQIICEALDIERQIGLEWIFKEFD